MPERSSTHREQPTDRVEPIDFALMIDAHFLQVVQQACFRRPEPASRAAEQGGQRFRPDFGLPFADEEGFL